MLATASCSTIGDTPNYPDSVDTVSGELVKQRVIEASSDPALASVCRLVIYRKMLWFKRAPKIGSAVLYNGRYLLTAAHNIYSPAYNRISSIEVICGTSDVSGTPAQQTLRRDSLATASTYSWGPFTGDEFQADFGVARLERAIEVAVPFELQGNATVGSDAQLAGFPKGDERMHYARGRLMPGYGAIIKYDIETHTGNSGGPVWSRSEGRPRLIAIHVTGSAGRVVDANFVAEVNRIIADLEGRPR